MLCGFAQLYIISRLPNLPSLPPEHMVNLVVEHGHIEPQTASLLNAQVLCQALEEVSDIRVLEKIYIA